MSTDSVKSKEVAKEDISWEELIRDSEAEIAVCQDKIKRLRKSLIYFRQKAADGVDFPGAVEARHIKIS